MHLRRTALAALAILGTVSAARADDTHLDLIVFQGVNNLPLLAAQEQGFFARHEISVTVKITGGSDELRTGLAEGRYQIAIAAVDNAVAMAEVAKVDIAIVTGGDNGFNHLFVQPDIATLADLRGKTVIVDAVNTAYAFQLYEILKRSGLNPGDYAVTPVGATNRRVTAMENDRNDKATMLNPPFTIQAAQAGLKDMGSAVKILGPYQASGAFVLRRWAAANPDTLVRFLQGYIEGMRWILDPVEPGPGDAAAEGAPQPGARCRRRHLHPRRRPRRGPGEGREVRHGRIREPAQAARRMDPQGAGPAGEISRPLLLREGAGGTLSRGSALTRSRSRRSSRPSRGRRRSACSGRAAAR